MTKEDKKNAYLYCKFRDEQFALYDEYAKRNGMMMKTLLVINALFYDAFYQKGGMTQKEICQRTFQSKQTVNLIIKNLLAENYVTVTEAPENVFRRLGDGHIVLGQKVLDNQVDRLFGLKCPLADFLLGHTALLVKRVIEKRINHQQRLHHHAVAFGIFIIESKLLVPEFTV